MIRWLLILALPALLVACLAATLTSMVRSSEHQARCDHATMFYGADSAQARVACS